MSASSVRSLVIVHVLASWFMVGMIWTIQLVHYPLFDRVGPDSYVAFQAEHVDRIGPFLLVPWLLEGLTLLGVLWLAFFADHRELRVAAVVGAVAMAVVLAISGFWSAPAHGDLADGFDASVHDRLMTANLIRSIAWTVCGVAATWVTARVWKPIKSGAA